MYLNLEKKNTRFQNQFKIFKQSFKTESVKKQATGYVCLNFNIT